MREIRITNEYLAGGLERKRTLRRSRRRKRLILK
jgi:hypothetical protein